MTDSNLVRGLREQDPAAVKHLKECFLPSIWRFVYVRTRGDRHLAEDIVGDAVLALVRAVRGEFDVENVTAWLRTVAVNKLRDHYRAAARVQHLLESGTGSAGDVHSGDPSLQQQNVELCEEVRAVMDSLTEQHRLVLEWKYLDGLSVRDIASRFGTTEKAAESILFRARQEFRQTRERNQNSTPRASSAVNGRQVRQQRPVDIDV